MAQSNKNLVCRLLGITMQEYEMQLFEAAFQYLELQLPGDDGGQQMLANGRYFWLWWTSQWEMRSEVVLHSFNFSDPLLNPSEITRKRARIAYNATHRVDRLNILINRHVMRERFQKVHSLENRASKTTIHEH